MVKDKTSKTQSFNLQDAIELLAELVKFRPRTLFCIIDNIYLLDDQSDRDFAVLFEKFINAISPEDAIITEPPLRTCYPTDAHSDMLVALVNAGRADKVKFDAQTEDEAGDNDEQLDYFGI